MTTAKGKQVMGRRLRRLQPPRPDGTRPGRRAETESLPEKQLLWTWAQSGTHRTLPTGKNSSLCA